jgi:hypothetical protein
VPFRPVIASVASYNVTIVEAGLRTHNIEAKSSSRKRKHTVDGKFQFRRVDRLFEVEKNSQSCFGISNLPAKLVSGHHASLSPDRYRAVSPCSFVARFLDSPFQTRRGLVVAVVAAEKAHANTRTRRRSYRRDTGHGEEKQRSGCSR